MGLSLLLLLASQAAGPTFEERARAFAYDPEAPLNLSEHGVEFNDLRSLRDRADVLRRELGLGPVLTQLKGE